jgi:hypothetical protein
MTTINTTCSSGIQIVDLPATFPNATQARYAWEQHRGITDSPLSCYAVIQTDKFGLEPVEVVQTFGVLDYAAAVLFVQKMVRMERDAAVQFHDSKTRYAFRAVNVYNFGGKPTIVL